MKRDISYGALYLFVLEVYGAGIMSKALSTDIDEVSKDIRKWKMLK